MTRTRICYVLYFVGISIVLGSYTTLIPPRVGWAGWVIGMIGWVAWPRQKCRQPRVARETDASEG